jgi:aryl-alcohol dehydrogenase-like predicted oxidoreductase
LIDSRPTKASGAFQNNVRFLVPTSPFLDWILYFIVGGETMDYRSLGRTGLKVSVVGLGCNNFGMRCDEEQTKAVVHKALDEGITFFDTADVYGGRGMSEELLGKTLGTNRKDIVLATKFGIPMGDGPLMQGASRRYIFNAIEDSLRRLGTDYVDLYQVHYPDPETPIAETLDSLTDLVSQGKVRYIGCSNFAGWQLAEAVWISRSHHLTTFATAQNQYSLLDRRIERELVPAANHYGVGILPYFPLASGLLTGKYRRGEEAPDDTRLRLWGERGQQALAEADFDKIERLENYVRERDRSLLELAIGWLASQPHVSCVMAGATKPEQIEQNIKAVEWKLTSEEIAEVNALLI